FTATVTPVAPGAGTPTGTVTFKDGSTILTTVALSAGKATFATSALTTAGPGHSITAVYNGSGDFNTSTSSAFTQTVIQADTTTKVTSSATPPAPRPSVPFTATVAPVAPGVGTPTGTVTFTLDTTPSTTVALSAGK